MALISADFLRPYKLANDWVWYYYSIIGVFPLYAIAFYKYIKCINWKHYEDKEHPKGLLSDKICNFFMYYAWVYYLLDCMFTLLSFQFTDQCRFHLWFHHFVCIFALPVVFSLGYYPWFVLTLPAHHALLIAFPDFEPLNFIYGVFIILFQYNASTQHFKKRIKYRKIHYSILALYIPLFGMYFAECKNYIPDYSF